MVLSNYYYFFNYMQRSNLIKFKIDKNLIIIKFDTFQSRYIWKQTQLLNFSTSLSSSESMFSKEEVDKMLKSNDNKELSEGDFVSQLKLLKEENEKLKNRLQFEIIGRTRAEVLLRKKFIKAIGGAAELKPIGYIKSCFPSRFSTPRQGILADKTRGFVKLDPSIIATSSLTGLNGFSHIWIIFIFHQNTNMHKFINHNDKAKKHKIFPSFVQPPQAGGERQGLFATRTPHRPNPFRSFPCAP